MKKYASELEFIGQVKRDGSGIEEVSPDLLRSMRKNPLVKDDKFKLKRLSISHDTYLAFNFNVFVVKLKRNDSNQLNPLDVLSKKYIESAAEKIDNYILNDKH